jgi:tetratricopeptide (TPR) repeat protein
MLRWTGGITTGLAVLILGPALIQPLRLGLAAGRSADPASKQRAIAEIEEIAAGLRQGSREAALRLLDSTEPPILDSGGREARSEALRAEIDALRRRLDAAPTRGNGSPLTLRVLDDEPAHARDGGAGTFGASSTSHASPRIERPEPGYSADPLRQAIACIRAGQHERALDVLEHGDASGPREYWRGKALEALGREPQALACYDKAAQLAPKSLEGKLARIDAEYLRWRASLTAPTSAPSTPAASAASSPADPHASPAAHAPTPKEAHE